MSCYQKQQTAVCNLTVDYSQVPGERILPFRIALNLADSVPEPGPGENQRFCYDIIAAGADTAQFADLSHLVLGICDSIPPEQIQNITVVVDGIPQQVVFGEGGNVELRPEGRPDPPTGCTGLKFDFPLNKVTGTMQLCFELTVPRQVAGIDVCLFGGNTTASGLTICGPVCAQQDGGCTATGYQRSTVCVPITVTPYARVGTPVTTCCGAPTVTAGNGCGANNRSCQFTICQQVCIQVPVTFDTDAAAGTPCILCGGVSSTDICTDCAAESPIYQTFPQ